MAKHIQFTANDEVERSLEEVRARMGLRDTLQVIQHALSLYETLTELQAEGAQITVTQQGGEPEALVIK